MNNADDKGEVQMLLMFEDENMKNRKVESQKNSREKNNFVRF